MDVQPQPARRDEQDAEHPPDRGDAAAGDDRADDQRDSDHDGEHREHGGGGHDGVACQAEAARAVGGGVTAEPTTTSANATIRRANAPLPDGSGSPNTIGPAAIVVRLAAALVSAIT